MIRITVYISVDDHCLGCVVQQHHKPQPLKCLSHVTWLQNSLNKAGLEGKKHRMCPGFLPHSGPLRAVIISDCCLCIKQSVPVFDSSLYLLLVMLLHWIDSTECISTSVYFLFASDRLHRCEQWQPVLQLRKELHLEHHRALRLHRQLHFAPAVWGELRSPTSFQAFEFNE